jgi:hypothetical protein
MSIFTHQRLNVDFSPADAVAVTPALTLAGVFAAMGPAYAAALQPAPAPLPAGHKPQSYCELTAAACASATVNYESLLPVPSNHCGGCRKVQLAEDQSPAWRTAAAAAAASTAAAPAPGMPTSLATVQPTGNPFAGGLAGNTLAGVGASSYPPPPRPYPVPYAPSPADHRPYPVPYPVPYAPSPAASVKGASLATAGGNTAAFCKCACTGLQNAGQWGCINSQGAYAACTAACLGKTPNDVYCGNTYAAGAASDWSCS